MEEFKGTRGPWFRDNSRAIGPKSREDDQSYGMVIPVGWVEFNPEIEVQVANQQIMASAPELLKVLQKTMDEIGHWLSQQKPELREEMIAAIAKALGK
ncbi:hypothetical protein AMN10_06800 [Klebsiella variicola]|nr:hypothetical protein [Klebsiella variicola]QOV59863.1 hypothetical protein AMN10_06800 [Klebsiella variicola]